MLFVGVDWGEAHDLCLLDPRIPDLPFSVR